MSIDFLLEAYQLKSLPRAGWLRVGIENPESVASHSWGLGLLIMLYCPPHINKERALELAMIHDLPEVIVGDITPHDPISKEEKQKQEQAAARKLLPPNLYNAWLEYQENQSLESRFVHQLDKLDMAVQAMAYRNLAPTQEFIKSAQRSLSQELNQLLSQFQQEILHEK